MQPPVTFDPMQSAPPSSLMRVQDSAYAEPLEKVAPGIVTLINGTQAVGEPWAQTLTRLASQIDATDEQRTILMMQAERAADGLEPMPVPSEQTQNGNGVLTLGLLAGLTFLLG